MKLLQQILNAKPHRLITVDAGATVLEALRILAQYDIGALLVTDQGQPAGIFSERDLAGRWSCWEGKPAIPRCGT